MNFFTQQGRTFLLAVVLAVGVVCLSGCKTKQEKLRDDFVNAMEESSKENAKWRSMASEAGMMLATYESNVLMVVSEKGDKFTKKDLDFEPRKDSKYFTYTVSEDGASCTATARKDIGYFKKGSTITTKYDKVKEGFVYSSNQLDVAKKLLLTFFANRNVEDDNGSKSTTPSANSSTDGCSFAELKTPPLVTFSSTDEDSKSWDEGWYDINLYVNPQTKDSILIMESYGDKGKEAYKFVFNKNLTDAEVTLCCFESVESSLCGEKKTLKTSKDAEKELRETFQTARKELSMKLSGSGGGNATEYVKSGTQYLDRGDKNNNKADYDLAIAEFDRAIKLDPNIAEAYFGRGRGYLRKGDNSRAIADYSQAIRLNPNDIISYSNRGRAYARMGDYDNAVADFESALRIDPNNTAIKQNLEKAKRREKGL
jgi:tetratricopeptide (TPR) repeat protein